MVTFRWSTAGPSLGALPNGPAYDFAGSESAHSSIEIIARDDARDDVVSARAQTSHRLLRSPRRDQRFGYDLRNDIGGQPLEIEAFTRLTDETGGERRLS